MKRENNDFDRMITDEAEAGTGEATLMAVSAC